MNQKELIYKIDAVIEYLESNGGHENKIYNRLCPGMGEPDSDIVEYAEDIRDYLMQINNYQKIVEEDLPF